MKASDLWTLISPDGMKFKAIPEGELAALLSATKYKSIDPEVQELIELRMRKKMRQEDIAKKTGLDQTHISRIETGEIKPRPKTKALIRNAIAVFQSNTAPAKASD